MRPSFSPIAFAGALIATLALGGCGIGKVTSISITTPTVCDPATGVCGIHRLDKVTVSVAGEGKCTKARINFGDGSFDLPGQDVDFDKGPWIATHSFERGWVGPKRIVAEGVTNCAGRATVDHHVFQENSFSEKHNVGFNRPTPGIMCYAVPRTGGPLPALRANTTVTVTTDATPKINFGCPFGGCTYDANGVPGSVASSAFTFPGFREFSLILVVGNQQVQGGSSVQFVTQGSGELLLCINTNNIYSNMTGGWGLTFSVDETNAR